MNAFQRSRLPGALRATGKVRVSRCRIRLCGLKGRRVEASGAVLGRGHEAPPGCRGLAGFTRGVVSEPPLPGTGSSGRDTDGEGSSAANVAMGSRRDLTPE